MTLRQHIDDAGPLGIPRVVEQKRCARCQEWKAVRHFWRRGLSKDGLAIYCKQCLRPMQAAVAQRRKERLRETKRAWVESNREYVRDYYRRYRDSDRETFRELRAAAMRRYRKKHADRINAKRRERYAARKAAEKGATA